MAANLPMNAGGINEVIKKGIVISKYFDIPQVTGFKDLEDRSGIKLDLAVYDLVIPYINIIVTVFMSFNCVRSDFPILIFKEKTLQLWPVMVAKVKISNRLTVQICVHNLAG